MSAVLDVDDLADRLGYVGKMAAGMPAIFAADGQSYGFSAQGGGSMGRVVPGVGLVLNWDADRLGLTRLPEHVIGKSDAMHMGDLAHLLTPVLTEQDGRKWVESRTLNGRRVPHVKGGAIATYDAIISARAGGKANDSIFAKPSITTVANAWSSIMSASGLPTAATYTAIPGGAVFTNASVGALGFGLTNPTGSDKKYLLTWGYTSSSQINMAILVDLLSAAGNISANTTGAQTVNLSAPTRYTTGLGVMITFEVTTALGATASNVTMNYTNSAGTTGQVSPASAMTGSAIVGRLQPAALGPFTQLVAGDLGVRTLQAVTFSAAMTAGVVAVHQYAPLHFVPGVAANAYIERDSTAQIDGLTELQNASLVIGGLAVYVLPNTTSSGVLTGFFRTCAG